MTNEIKLHDEQSSDFSAMAIQKAELDMQISTAKAFPRSFKASLESSIEMATLTREVAESCIYCLSRKSAEGTKNIEGASIRLAEILISSWGNVHAGSRVVGVIDKSIVAEAVVWDLEKNNKMTVQQSRRATYKNGGLYNDDMLVVTGNAAAAIAFRNAVFKIIPNTIRDTVLTEVKKYLKSGKKEEIQEHIKKGFEYFQLVGIGKDALLKLLGKASMDELDGDDYINLLGMRNALKDGYISKEELLSDKGIRGEDESLSKADQIVNLLKKAQNGKDRDDAPITSVSEAPPVVPRGTEIEQENTMQNLDKSIQLNELFEAYLEKPEADKSLKGRLLSKAGVISFDKMTAAQLEASIKHLEGLLR